MTADVRSAEVEASSGDRAIAIWLFICCARVTISAARMLGYERSDAARFSMLLSIPAIAGAGFLITLELVTSGDATLDRGAVIAGILAFITALAAIAFLMRWLTFAGFAPFVIYRILMGGAILYWVYAT